MCSIIGVSSDKPVDFNDIRLLYLMAEDRGGDACGFTNRRSIIKSAVNSIEFVEDYMTTSKKLKGKVPEKFPRHISEFIGHTRYATYGNKKDSSNAHPFYNENIIGVHNGSIRNFEDLQELQDTKYDVDSQVLYHYISKYGLKRTLPLLRGKLALAFYNKHPDNNMIHLYRCGNKPLCIGRKDGAIFFGSLPSYLRAIECHDIEYINEHTLYKLKNGNIVECKQIKQDQKPVKDTNKNKGFDILYDRREELRELKDDYITSLIDDLEEEEENHIKDKETDTDNTVVTGFRPKTSEDTDFKQIKHTFKAPMYAKSVMTEDEETVLFWFDEDDVDKVNIEIQGYEPIEQFNFGVADDRVFLKEYMPQAYKVIKQEYDSQKLTFNIRNKIESL